MLDFTYKLDKKVRYKKINKLCYGVLLMKKPGITLVSVIYFIFTLLCSLICLSYGIALVLEHFGFASNLWFTIINMVFKFFFSDLIIMIFIGFAIGVVSAWVSLQLLKRKKWARLFFICFSIILIPWIVYRLINAFTDMPFYVSLEAIFGSNPLTKYPSIIYFFIPFVLVLLEILLVYTIVLLVGKTARQEFK